MSLRQREEVQEVLPAMIEVSARVVYLTHCLGITPHRVTAALKTRTMVNVQENSGESIFYGIAYILGKQLGMPRSATIRLPSTQVLHKNIHRSGGNRLTV